MMTMGWRILKVVTLSALLSFLLVSPGVAHGSPRKNPAGGFWSSSQVVYSPINETTTTTNLIRGFIHHVSPRLGSSAAAAAADPTYFAFHGAEATPSGYYGFVATLDVYGFPDLKHGQGTAGSVWVVDEGDGAQANAKAIIVGWNVLPALYGDSRTHFFTSWTNDGFTKTGCLNTKCAGFQAEKGAAIAPGDVIPNVSVPKGGGGGGSKQILSLKIVKQGGASGDWVVHAGLNGREPAPIGRFPRSLFTGGFADKAAAVRFGGMVTAPAAADPPPPMGSGYLPGPAAASVSGVQLVVGPDGRAAPVTSDLPKLESRPEKYAVGTVENGRFFYGGPAKGAQPEA